MIQGSLIIMIYDVFLNYIRCVGLSGLRQKVWSFLHLGFEPPKPVLKQALERMRLELGYNFGVRCKRSMA